jgi:hypothetical protein
MWPMTKYGFYSIVQKQPGEYHVRSRERQDIENLMTHIAFGQGEIIESERSDYAFRIIVKKEDVEAILRFLGETIDYDNFKDKIDQTPDQNHKPYHEVWGILANALGAYGRKPSGLKR